MTEYTRLRWNPLREEWQYQMQDAQGQWSAWAALSPEWPWGQTEVESAVSEAQDAFGLPVWLCGFDGTEPEVTV